MSKISKYLLIGLPVLVAILIVWWINSLAVAKQDFYRGVLNRRDNAANVSSAFTLALWLHDDIAYEITDPALWGELDNWMSTHIPRDCSILDSGQLDSIGSPTNLHGAYHLFSCSAGDLELDNVRTQQDSSGKWYVTHWDVLDS